MTLDKNSTTNHCCICLEKDDIVSCCFRDKIRHIPCKCNMYCHKYCFEKTNTTQCMICKQEYQYSWGQDPNKPKKKNYCKIFKKYIKKKYILGKISLQKQNRRVEKNLINCMTNLYHPDFGNCCLDMIAATTYSIILLIVCITTVMCCLMIGGYYLNFIICTLFGMWDNNYFCLLPLDDGALYILGILGFLLLLSNISCCYCCFGPLCASNSSSRKVFPYGIA